jgi:sulfoxide reductase catalytic subunit YedY
LISYGFPLWLRITHYINFLLLTLLIRSGIQILADHPRLYWNEHCTPGSEWIRFSHKKIPSDQLWTSMDEAISLPDWLGLPGGHHTLGLARHWHFFSVLFWVTNGLIYLLLLFATNNWGRLIPSSWSIFPEAWHTLGEYLTFQIPPPSSFHPYDSLQKLAYAGIVFWVSPFMILTGAAMSPSIAAQFPWYPALFGGRQNARSFHFLLLVAYLAFLFVHVSMVVLVRFSRNVSHIVLGQNQGPEPLGMGLGALLLLFVLFVNWYATKWSQRRPRQVQHWTGLVAKLLDHGLSGMHSRQAYSIRDISPYFWVNGLPPVSTEWQQWAKNQFAEWKLDITGLVKNPMSLSLAELKELPGQQQQVTEHVCIQGWSGIAEWAGIPLVEIMRQCQPLPGAKYIIFHSSQMDEDGIEYYSSLTLEEATSSQTILAYEMNHRPLPIEHGAPLRLRVENKLGFKMTKWIRSLEFVSEYRTIGLGQGGYREDRQYYAIGAEI